MANSSAPGAKPVGRCWALWGKRLPRNRWEEPHKDQCGLYSAVMSAKTVTEDEGTGREAVLRAMQGAAESAAGKKGVPKGPQQGTKGINCDTSE